jgi:tetratricopeptide (TPR) repeat protein
MKNNFMKIMIIMVSIIMAMSLLGCNLKNQSEIKPPEVRETESSKVPPAASRIDPVKVAESEKFYDRGLKCYEQYNYQEAIANFDKAILASPDNYKVYTAKGIALCFEGEYKAGMELIQKTLDMSPDYVPAFYDMAMGYKLQEDYDKSLYWFERTIQGDPQNTWSYYGISTIYADRGNVQASLEYLRKAIALNQEVKAVAQQQAHFAQMRKLPEFQNLVR